MKISLAVRQKFHGFNLAQEISSHGYLSSLYTSYYGGFFGKRNDSGFTIRNSSVKTHFLSAVKTYLMRNNSIEVDDCFGNWVASLLGEEDIVITWGIQALPIIKRARELGIKVVLERGSSHVQFQRDILFEEYGILNLPTEKIEKSFSERRVERELMEYDLADIVSIPSNFVCGTFTDKGFDQKKLFLNHYGTNLTEFVYAPKAHDTFRIVYVGALSIRKGIHYLLEAFKSLNLPNSELWLVGDLEAEVESFFIKYQSDKIKHFKPVSQRNLNLLYNQCDVFAICSIEEGMAMVQAQAMACGLPIICTKNTGGGDLIDDGVSGFVLPIRNVNLLKEKLELFYEDRERLKYMGKMAKIAANNTLSWQNYGKRAVDFYKHINGEISV